MRRISRTLTDTMYVKAASRAKAGKSHVRLLGLKTAVAARYMSVNMLT